MSLESEFRSEVRKHLEPLAKNLVPLLSQLIRHKYPKEVEALVFEVFSDGFTSGFPARVFFMDGENSEFFIYENGEAQYPSPIDPDLLDIEQVYPDELEERFSSQDEDLDTFTLAGLELIDWFAKCWNQAGGNEFPRTALITIHDDTEVLDLKTGVWIGE
jgi:hypothetical protein